MGADGNGGAESPAFTRFSAGTRKRPPPVFVESESLWVKVYSYRPILLEKEGTIGEQGI